MKAMILAAGRGKRMMPLTADQPKPMLTVHDKPLIGYHLERLRAAGITEVIINLAWCGEKIQQYCGDGSQWDLAIKYSQEVPEGLETAGGIIQALPLLGDAPFIVINGDIFTDYDVGSLTQLQLDNGHAHLVLVENPPHHPIGDFAFSQGFLDANSVPRYTFAGIALYHPAFFAGLPADFRPLAPLLRAKMAEQKVQGERYLGLWVDVGTPERLAELNLIQGQQDVG